MRSTRSPSHLIPLVACCAMGLASVVMAQPPVPETPQPATPSADLKAAEFETYVSQVYGWSVDYPRDWRLDDDDPAWVKIHSAGGLPEAVVGIHCSTHSFRSLDDAVGDFLPKYVAFLTQIGLNVEQLSRRQSSLRDGPPAVEVVHRLGTGIEGRSKAKIALAGNRMLIIDAECQATDWESLEPYFDRILGSFAAGEAKVPDSPPPQSQQTEREKFMAEARRAAAAGKAFEVIVEEQGVFVFNNTPRPLCYTFMIPGDWEQAGEPGLYKSRQGQTQVGVQFVTERALSRFKGDAIVQRAGNWLTHVYEEALGEPLTDVRLTPFKYAPLRVWKWQAGPVHKEDLRVELATKLIVDFGPDAVALITLSGVKDEEALARRILESLKTTKDPSCYWFPLGQIAREVYP